MVIKTPEFKMEGVFFKSSLEFNKGSGRPYIFLFKKLTSVKPYIFHNPMRLRGFGYKLTKPLFAIHWQVIL